MSDRTKHFADEDQKARDEIEQRAQETKTTQGKQQELQELFSQATATYKTHFDTLRDELRSDNLTAYVLEQPQKAHAIDPNSQEELSGHTSLTLTFLTAKTEYEIALLQVDKPSYLCMLCWRKNKKNKYFKVLGSATTPAEVVENPALAERHFENAVAATKGD